MVDMDLAQMKSIIIGVVAVVLASSSAHAIDSLCEAVAIETIRGDGYTIKVGEKIDAITQYNKNQKTGATTLCSHGGGCYPAKAFRLTNCTIDRSHPDRFGDEISYGLDLIRSKVAPDALRQNDVELRLLELGLCNGCADNAAAFYVKMPASRCAALVRGALEGNPTAIEKLKDDPEFCHE